MKKIKKKIKKKYLFFKNGGNAFIAILLLTTNSRNFFNEIKENIRTKRNNENDKFIQLNFTNL